MTAFFPCTPSGLGSLQVSPAYVAGANDESFSLMGCCFKQASSVFRAGEQH